MSYTREQIHEIVEKQREFFLSGETLSIKFRKEQLKKLKQALIDNTEKLEKALHEDLGRCDAEAYFCDIGDVIMEINECIHGLNRWSRPETHFSGLACFPSIFTKVYKMPYGVSLIISPFNFPILLSVGVLAAAIAGGNTALIKASSKSAACTQALKEIIAENFDPNYIVVIDEYSFIKQYYFQSKKPNYDGPRFG